MEFFEIASVHTTEEALQQDLSLTALPQFCASIYTLISESGDTANVFCLWGHFSVQRQMIRGGVRFTLPDCPNALAWTVTTGFPPAPDHVVIHCTINRTEHDPDFVESIETFVRDWRSGIEEQFETTD